MKRVCPHCGAPMYRNVCEYCQMPVENNVPVPAKRRKRLVVVHIGSGDPCGWCGDRSNTNGIYGRRLSEDR